MRFFLFLALLVAAGCNKPKPAPVDNATAPPSREPAATDDWRSLYIPKNDAWRKVEQHFLLGNTTEPEGLDPGIVTGVPEHRLLLALFEGLTSLDPKTLEPRPGTAKSWDISADGLTYTFQVREDARWSDGQPLTSQHFYDAWKRVLTPVTAATYAYQLFPIANAEAYQKGEIADFAKVGVTAPDPRTLVVTLGAPCPYFLDLCAFFTLYPVRIDVIAEHGDRWQRPEHMVSNGPFKLTAWEARQHIIMEKNPNYWDADFVKLDKITAYPYDNLDTTYNLFLNKKIHWSPAIPQPKLEEIKRNPDYYVAPYLGTYFYRFNCSKPPFNNPAVRKAFSLAVDRSIVTDHVLRAGQQPATWFCPPVAGYEPVKGLPYNRDLARETLAAAGYGPDNPFPEIELLFNTQEAHKMVAESIVQQLSDNLNVNISLRNTEWKIYLDHMDKLEYDIIRSGWIGDYGDPNTFFDMWVTGGGNNRCGWSHAKYDKLVRQSQNEADHAKRLALFTEMEKILVEEEFPILPIYIYVNQGLLAEQVLGWHENVRDIHPWNFIWLEE
jgi:oligopeptide transport system substrate-binding protein